MRIKYGRDYTSAMTAIILFLSFTTVAWASPDLSSNSGRDELQSMMTSLGSCQGGDASCGVDSPFCCPIRMECVQAEDGTMGCCSKDAVCSPVSAAQKCFRWFDVNCGTYCCPKGTKCHLKDKTCSPDPDVWLLDAALLPHSKPDSSPTPVESEREDVSPPAYPTDRESSRITGMFRTQTEYAKSYSALVIISLFFLVFCGVAWMYSRR
ncbi:hypothetical protein V1512DRAFT_259104 [Lipomyces arxii]|uniref:uncharacterized protein n=1 Tax=Lipomyces arxii TaxID=56418 RepID=UPI0034CD2C46